MRYRSKPGGVPTPLSWSFSFLFFTVLVGTRHHGRAHGRKPHLAFLVPESRRVSAPTNLATHGAELFTFSTSTAVGIKRHDTEYSPGDYAIVRFQHGSGKGHRPGRQGANTTSLRLGTCGTETELLSQH